MQSSARTCTPPPAAMAGMKAGSCRKTARPCVPAIRVTAAKATSATDKGTTPGSAGSKLGEVAPTAGDGRACKADDLMRISIGICLFTVIYLINTALLHRILFYTDWCAESLQQELILCRSKRPQNHTISIWPTSHPLSWTQSN